MPVSGFHSEWVTIDNSRILLSCRGSFPGESMRFMAKIAVTALSVRSKSARLIQIFYDDKACVHQFIFASDETEDRGFGDEVVGIVNDIYRYGNDIAEMIIVEPGDKNSDHYVHMEYLSCEAGVAVDRWKHANEAYMRDVETPS